MPVAVSDPSLLLWRVCQTHKTYLCVSTAAMNWLCDTILGRYASYGSPSLSRFPSLDPFLSIWPHIVPANLLSATAGGTLVLVYHMMHLPGGAQYVFDFRLCLKPTASSSPPPQPFTRMCGRLNAVSQNVGKMLWSALSCLFGVFVVEYERHFVRGHWNGFQKLQLFIEM